MGMMGWWDDGMMGWWWKSVWIGWLDHRTCRIPFQNTTGNTETNIDPMKQHLQFFVSLNWFSTWSLDVAWGSSKKDRWPPGKPRIMRSEMPEHCSRSSPSWKSEMPPPAIYERCTWCGSCLPDDRATFSDSGISCDIWYLHFWWLRNPCKSL